MQGPSLSVPPPKKQSSEEKDAASDIPGMSYGERMKIRECIT